MGTPFTDADDKELVQSAKRYEDAGRRVVWAEVTRKVRRAKKSVPELRRRLEALKRTYGLHLSEFPRCFFGRPVRRQPRQPPRVEAARPSPTSQVEPSDSDILTALGSQESLLLRGYDSGATMQEVTTDVNEGAKDANKRATAASSNLVPFERDAVENALDELFGCVTGADVRAPLQTPHFNVGEVLPSSVDAMVRTIGGMDSTDMFLDIVAGLGSILVQIALQTAVAQCVGVEVREDLFKIGRRSIQGHTKTYSQLKRVKIVHADIRDVALATKTPFCNATVIYSNNVVFEASVNAYLRTARCNIQPARALVTTLSFCSRHRRSCKAEFCKLWHLHTTLLGKESWTARSVSLFAYLRNN